MIKSVVFFRRKAGMPVDDDVLAGDETAHRGPGIKSIGFVTRGPTDAMRQSATTPEYARTRADEPNFIAPGDVDAILTTEHVIVR